ncbi:MAG: RluA family pseudouridine synthase [Bacilli bacterium]|nr:RluA family pseudouridine synthase [Bacilli bacterium]
MDARIKVLFEDNHILVALKPPGILSQAGEKKLPDMLTELKNYLKIKYDKPGNVFLGLVHRLDLNVGGVMVFAKTSKAASRLSEAIRNHIFQKHYLAVVEGVLAQEEMIELVDWLVKTDGTRTTKKTEEDAGKLASLTYVSKGVAKYLDKKCTLLDISLKTGRFHQIRAQFASRGYPLVGDQKYGATIKLPDSALGLWAYRLHFEHPVTKEPMDFTARPTSDAFKMFAINGLLDIFNFNT